MIVLQKPTKKRRRTIMHKKIINAFKNFFKKPYINEVKEYFNFLEQEGKLEINDINKSL